MIDEGAVRRLLLVAEVTDFLYREADLLDERRYEEWLCLLADDYQYSAPLRMNVRHDDIAEREQTRAGEDLAGAMAATAGVRCRTLDVTADFFAAVGGTAFRDLPYPRSCEVLAGLRVARAARGSSACSVVGEGSA